MRGRDGQMRIIPADGFPFAKTQLPAEEAARILTPVHTHTNTNTGTHMHTQVGVMESLTFTRFLYLEHE